MAPTLLPRPDCDKPYRRGRAAPNLWGFCVTRHPPQVLSRIGLGCRYGLMTRTYAVHSKVDATPLTVYAWPPPNKPRAVVQIAHGVAEHAVATTACPSTHGSQLWRELARPPRARRLDQRDRGPGRLRRGAMERLGR